MAIAAEARIVGAMTTARRWGFHRETIAEYIAQVNSDERLEKACSELVRQMLSNVSGEISELLATAALALKARIATAETTQDAKIIEAIGNATKIFAELDVAYRALEQESVRTVEAAVEVPPRDDSAITVRGN